VFYVRSHARPTFPALGSRADAVVEGGRPDDRAAGARGLQGHPVRRQRRRALLPAQQISVTSGTIFAYRKLSLRDLLLAVSFFVNGVGGVATLRLCRELGVHSKTAYVLLQKIREALTGEVDSQVLEGQVEVDGVYVGGYVKPENEAGERVDLRLAENRTGKRRSVVVMRQRGGRTVPKVCLSEDQATDAIRAHVAKDAVVYAGEAGSWDALHAFYQVERVNHGERYAGPNGVNTNQAESWFSRVRRAEIGVHHKIAGDHLGLYAGDLAWREDRRRWSNGTQHEIVLAIALAHVPSGRWIGLWQRRPRVEEG
jgi:hypothetical protein